MSTTRAQHNTATLLIVFLFAVLASVSVILLFNGDRLVKLAVVGGMFFPLVLYVSGNPRLFFLIGLVFTAPLALSINFKTLIHIGGAPSYAVDLSDFFLVPLIVFQLRDAIRGYGPRWVFPTLNYWWLGLIALGFVAIMIGPLRNLPGFETLKMVKGMLLFVVIVNECKRVKQIQFVILSLAAGLCVQIFVGFVQFILKRDLGLQALGEASSDAIKGANLGVYLTQDSVYRISSLMGHPNLLSAYLAFLIPIFIALLFSNYRTWLKVCIMVLIAAAIITLVMTLSRSGWAAFGVAFLVLLTITSFDKYIRQKFKAIRWAMITLTALGGLIISGPIIQRFTQSDGGALDFRFEFMIVAAKMVEAKPFLGFGINTFVYNMAPYTKYGNTASLIKAFGDHWPAVHNIYLLVWSEQGTVGLILFLGFHFHVFRIYRQNSKFKLQSQLHAINIGIICGFIALMIDGMASFYLRVPAATRVFWVVMAVLVAINIWNKRNAYLQYNQKQNEKINLKT